MVDVTDPSTAPANYYSPVDKRQEQPVYEEKPLIAKFEPAGTRSELANVQFQLALSRLSELDSVKVADSAKWGLVLG